MDLIEAALRFPTVVFSLGMVVVLAYWLLVILGALDIDLLGGDGDVDVSGAGKGLDDAIVGAKGAAEGLKVDAPGGGLWAGLGLSKVPITISVSAVFFVCWLLSLLGMYYAPRLVGSGPWVAPTLLPVVLIIGLPVAGALVRPLGRVFELREGKSNRDYIGHTCTISTGHVDDGFGQATVEDGGTVLVIPVRCDRPGALSRNDRALIIDFDPARHAYVVEPAADMLPARETEPGQTA